MHDFDSRSAALKRAVIARDLSCRRCGYNVRGVRLDHPCPECGLSVKETITAEVDPAASTLPQLQNPKRVGDAVLWLMLCQLAFTLTLSLPGLDRILNLLQGDVSPPSDPSAQPLLPLTSASFALLSLWSCWAFLSPGRSDDSRVRRDVRWIVLGALTAASVGVVDASLQWSEGAGVGVMRRGLLQSGYAIAGILAYCGAGGVLLAIGQRSRTYRESRGGRQSAQGMMVALAMVALSSLAMSAGAIARVDALQQGGRFAVAAGVVMVLIGQVYLVVNVWWIRSALRRPPARISELVRIEADTSVSGPADRKPES